MCIINIQQRVTEIIKYLEQYSDYTDDLYEELGLKLSLLSHNLENSFYNFFFCLDWRYLYHINERLTLYDIYYKAGVKSFKKAYLPLKKMALEGDITNISQSYQNILGKLKEGLKEYKIDKEDIVKGIYEFMQDFLNKLVNVDYETTDYNQPYLVSSSITSRFATDVYEKFVQAYKISCWFNTSIKTFLETGNIIISNTCFLHILLRHYGPLKIFTEYHPNPLFDRKIKNGIGKSVLVTVFRNEIGDKVVIAQDGMFVSKPTGSQTYLCDDMLSIVDIAKHILPMLSSNIIPNRSPNVIFYNNELYGVEFSKYIYRESGKIIVNSIYPLNSTWQKLHGISAEDYNHIINMKDVPLEYKNNLHIEHP